MFPVLGDKLVSGDSLCIHFQSIKMFLYFWEEDKKNKCDNNHDIFSLKFLCLLFYMQEKTSYPLTSSPQKVANVAVEGGPKQAELPFLDEVPH